MALADSGRAGWAVGQSGVHWAECQSVEDIRAELLVVNRLGRRTGKKFVFI